LLYLGEEHIRQIGFQWEELVDCIETAVSAIDAGDCVQPLKPYLRYRNPRNRMIAMPAYVGGPIHSAGLKWIASFPGNLDHGLPRAHSVTILNDADTGRPTAMINTALVSAARTAAVSGLMLRHWLAAKSPSFRLRVGIIGWGPVGRLHADMCRRLYGDRTDFLYAFDIRGVKEDVFEDAGAGVPFRTAGSWQELYAACNIVMTCTVSDDRYIDRPPSPGSLLLDVSLRDYRLEAIRRISAVVVDDWNEVCRENTDIELLHLHNGLAKSGTIALTDVVCRQALSRLDETEPVLFCPMGMASFDIAAAAWYARQAAARGIGMTLS